MSDVLHAFASGFVKLLAVAASSKGNNASARNFPLVADRLIAIEAQRGPLPEAQRAAALAVGEQAERHGEAWITAEPDGTLIVGACEAMAFAETFTETLWREQRTTAVTIVAPDGTTRRKA